METNCIHDDVKEYFERLGYKVTWDAHVRSGQEWYEICDEGGMVLQIDTGVPVHYLVHDLCQLHLGKTADSPVDYSVSGPENERTKLLYKRVYDLKYGNCLPSGQMLLPL